MIKIPSLRNIESVIRMVPVVKDLLPSNKAGLNSLIDAPAYKIRKLEDALHDKKAEICKLRENIKELEQVLIITHDELKDAQNKIELLQETIGGYQS
jgi:chromosome segregation ATPase